MRLPTSLREIDLLQRMEDLADALGIARIERREVGPAEAARAVAAVGQHELADVERLAGRQRGLQEVAGGLDARRAPHRSRPAGRRPSAPRRDNPSSRAAAPCRASPSPSAPCCASYQARKVREGTPRSGPVRCLGERRIGMRAVVFHGPSLAVRIAVDHPDVADALAQQIPACGLAAHAGADHQHVEHPLAVRAGALGHPVGRRIVQPGEIVPRDPLRSLQTRLHPRQDRPCRASTLPSGWKQPDGMCPLEASTARARISAGWNRSRAMSEFVLAGPTLGRKCHARTPGLDADARQSRRRPHLRQSRHDREPAARFAARLSRASSTSCTCTRAWRSARRTSMPRRAARRPS